MFGHLAKTKTTITALAKALGLSTSVVYAWKAGRRFPSEGALDAEVQDLAKGIVKHMATTKKKATKKRATKKKATKDAPLAPALSPATQRALARLDQEAQRKLADVVSGKTPVAARRASTKKRKGSTRGGKVSGKRLRAAREARKLSRAALAKQLGVSAGSVQNWESGRSVPRGENLTKVRAFVNEGTPKAAAPLPALPGATQAPPASSPGGDAATVGAAQVASAYLTAGHPLRPEDVIAFVKDLRHALS